MSLPSAAPPHSYSAATVTLLGLTLGQTVAPLRAMASLLAAISSTSSPHAHQLSHSPPPRRHWLTFLLEELGAPQRCPTIWCDNASTIHLTKDAVYHGRFKHIELRYFFICNLVQVGHFRLGRVYSAANLAGIFTKAFPHVSHSSLLRLGLTPPVALPAS
ncbi:unnamed protein product [Closterium sp. NIES-53]